MKMGKQKIDKDQVEYDLDTDVELEKLEKDLDGIFNEYHVEYPSEAEMMMTIEAIRPYVPKKEIKWKAIAENMSAIMKQSLHEVFYLSSLFWTSNILLLLIGMTAVFYYDQNPYELIFLLAPIPTITGVLEILKSRNIEMAELEMSFKYNLQEIILSRMVVVGGFSSFINLIFICSIAFVYHDILVWKLILFWVTPFTIITAISFVVVNRFRHVSAISISLFVWIIFGSLASQMNLQTIPSGVYILISILALVAIVLQIKQIYKKGVSYEFNY